MAKTVNTNPLASLTDLTRNATQAKVAPAPKEKTNITSEAADGWGRFCDYAHQYNDVESKSRGVTVWIDEDIKQALDKIKLAACNVPVRHLVSAAVRTFIEEHNKEIKEAIMQSGNGLL